MPFADRSSPAISTILCESCGYTLDGLPIAGNCPECGTPIELSTTKSPRHRPAFEVKPSWRTFFRTTGQVIAHPTGFFKTLALEPRSNSFGFRVRTIILLGWVTFFAATLHYNWAIAYWGFSPTSTGAVISIVIGIVGSQLVMGVALLITRPVAWLTTLESRFWGYRLPRLRVQKALDYQSSNTLPAALLILLVVATHWTLLRFGVVDYSFGTTYLYLLSGVVIVSVGYVFLTYTRAMRAIMYANASPQTPS